MSDERESAPPKRAEPRPVDPLELFYDLVFALAISELSAHLFGNVTWRGIAETLVLLCAVFTVWVHSAFEATFFDITRRSTQIVVLVLVTLGLFMNAGIRSAFGSAPLLFAVSLVVTQVYRGFATRASAPSAQLREHYQRMLWWLVASAPLWIAGALMTSRPRLWWWAAAAAVDVAGTVLAHPSLGGRHLHTSEVPFDGAHMTERLRLYLIVALGEVVLTTGSAIANHPSRALTLVAGGGAFVITTSLWALYFGGTNYLVEEHMAHTADPVRTARLGANGQYVVLAGLIAVAVGCQIVVGQPRGHASISLTLLLYGGTVLYVAAQSWFLVATTDQPTRGRWVGCTVIAGEAVGAAALPPVVALWLLGVTLAVLAFYLIRRKHADVGVRSSEAE